MIFPLYVIYLFIYFCIASQAERHMGSYNSCKIQLTNQHDLTFCKHLVFQKKKRGKKKPRNKISPFVCLFVYVGERSVFRPFWEFQPPSIHPSNTWMKGRRGYMYSTFIRLYHNIWRRIIGLGFFIFRVVDREGLFLVNIGFS
jgi:hypothetical protein